MAKTNPNQPNPLEDPRFTPILQGARPIERFIAVALIFLLGAMGFDKVLQAIAGAGAVDINAKVAGKPFSHWYGKNHAQCKSGGCDEEQLREIADAHADRDIPWDHPDDQEPVEKPAEKPKQSPPPATKPTNTQTPPPEDEPRIGDFLLKDLAGLSDDEILAKDGLSRGSIKLVREYEAKQKASGKGK